MTIEELRERFASGESFDYRYFWRPRPESGGGKGIGVLSQWWPEAFEVGGETFWTAEHYMMAGKAALFGDKEVRAELLADPNPAKAKDFGQKVRNFDESKWRAQREAIVLAGNLAKFRQHADSCEVLLATGKAVLVEASPYDRIWGIGLGPDAAPSTDPPSWRGANLLGFILMRVRDTLRAEVAA